MEKECNYKEEHCWFNKCEVAIYDNNCDETCQYITEAAQEQTPCAPLNLLVRQNRQIDALFAIMLGAVGVLLATNGNTVAAVFAVVVLVGMLNDQTTKELIQTQREYIDTLERALNN